MTLLEAQQLAEKLASINLDIWFAPDGNSKKALKSTYRTTYKSIIEAGFKLKCSKVWSDKHGIRIPHVDVVINKHKEMLKIIDNRSENAHYVGDCTTRALCFCINASYDDMQKTQFALSRQIGRSWKNERVWGKIFEINGYCSIKLPKKISRASFIRLFKDAVDSGTIASLSSGHIAAIDMAEKKVLDTWDSTGGRIYKIYVPASQFLKWYKAVNARLS